jgi:serine/threonine protein kinase
MRCENGRIVLMDFGAASRTASQELPFLTPVYAAPESLEGAAAHPTADIYALGTLLFRLVTGAYPTDASDLEELHAARREGKRAQLAASRDDLPVSFVSTVERALSGDPSRRFQSASELEGSLRRALRIAFPLPGEGPQTLRPLQSELELLPEKTRLHGRDLELDRLRNAFQRASSGHGNVALIVGEAGIGKSRLIDESISRLERSGATFRFLYGPAARPPR